MGSKRTGKGQAGDEGDEGRRWRRHWSLTCLMVSAAQSPIRAALSSLGSRVLCARRARAGVARAHRAGRAKYYILFGGAARCSGRG